MTGENQALLERISEFLSEKHKSKDDGYAPVSQEDYFDLYDIFEKLIEAKWGPDADGDYPVETLIINRHERRWPTFKRLPYSHKDMDGYFRAALDNVRAACEELNLAFKLKRLKEEE